MRSEASMFLSTSKAVLTCWLYHGAEHRRCRKRFPVIMEAMNDIISKDPILLLEVLAFWTSYCY